MPQDQNTQPIDPQVKALVSAIGQAETGPTSVAAYSKQGASGEFGRYQFMPDTYKAYAQKYLGDANAQPTVENQNKIAYSFVDEKKKAGYSPAQIASMWNAGEAHPNAYKEDYAGTNSQGVNYNTPAYAAKVSQYYEQFKNQNTTLAGGQDSQGQDQGQPNLLQDLTKTASTTGAGVSNALQQTLSGQINPLSGLIQGAGAIAGGLGGALNNVIEHTPLVGTAYKGLEGLIGQGAGALASTSAGQGLVSNYQQFSQAHPELSGDIAGAANIASILPVGKGLSLLKGGLTDAAETAVKGSATKAAEEEIKSGLTAKATRGLVSAQSRGIDPVKAIVSNKDFLPQIVRSGDKFVYDTSKATGALNTSLDADENTLQESLKQGVKKNIGVDLDQVREQVLKDVSKNFAMSGNYKPAIKAVNDYFDSFGASTGGRKVIDLNELNAMKRDVRGAVFDVGGDVRGTASAEFKYQMGQSLMKQVEKTAEKAGVKGVKALNKEMGTKIEALKVLGGLTGKAVKGGSATGREVARDIAGGAGEMAGNAMGVPLAGTFAGRGLAGLVGRKLPRTAITKLAESSPLKATIAKGTKKVATGLAGQAITRRLQPQQ